MSRSQSHSKKGVVKGAANASQAIGSISVIFCTQDAEYEDEGDGAMASCRFF